MPLVGSGRLSGALAFTATVTGNVNLTRGTIRGALVLSGSVSEGTAARPTGALVLAGSVGTATPPATTNDIRNHIDRDSKGLLAATRLDPATSGDLVALTLTEKVRLPNAFSPITTAPFTAVRDSSGNGRDGTYEGTPTSVTGLVTGDGNTAVAFGGDPDAIDWLSAIGGYSGPFSIEFILNVTTGTTGFVVDLGKLGNPRFILFLSGGNLRYGDDSSSQLLGTWTFGAATHCVVTYNSATNAVRFYKNGSFVAQVTGSAFNLTGAGMAAKLMRAFNGTGSHVTGTLDEVAFYSSILADARIAAHAALVAGGDYSGAVLADAPHTYYRLDEGTAGTAGTLGDIKRDAAGLWIYVEPGQWVRIGAGASTASGTTLEEGKIWVGDSLDRATARTPSGDLSVSNTGVFTLGTVPVAKGGTGQTSYTNGQLLIGNTTGNTLTKATLTGTANQIVVTNGAGSITLSLPQNIHTAATPTFAATTLTDTSNQIVLGTTRTLTLTAPTPAGSSRVLTLPDPGGNDSVVYLALAQTLTNKTLTSPTLGGTVAGTPTWASSQAITLSTAAQPSVTSVGTLTSLTVSGTLTMSTASIGTISMDTADASDNKVLRLAGGGAGGDTRGGYIDLAGNERGGGYSGRIDLVAGNSTNSEIAFTTAGSQRMLIDGSGRLTIGTASTIAKVNVIGGNLYVDAFDNGGNGLYFRDPAVNAQNLSIRSADFGAGFYDGLQINGYRGVEITTNNGSRRVFVDLSGNVVVGSAALATTATDGFLYIPSCAGTPTGAPTAYMGRVPLVYDSTNDKLYVYRSGWKTTTVFA